MAGFDVLQDVLDLKKGYLLEASAGTGKTFAIEHLAMRLFFEEAIPLSEMLFVTFTNKAVNQLKWRLEKRLEQTLESLEKGQVQFSYHQSFLDKGPDALFLAKAHLGRLLAHFDQMSIFTLHSFAYRILKNTARLSSLFIDNIENTILFEQVVKDLLRTGDLFCPLQWQLLLSSFDQDVGALIEAVRTLVQKRKPIVLGMSYNEALVAFKKVASRLQEKYRFVHTDLLRVLEEWAACFEGMCDRSRQLKKERQSDVESLCQALMEPTFFPLVPTLVKLAKNKRLKRAASSLAWQGFCKDLTEALFPLVKEATDPLYLLARLAESCRQVLLKEVNRDIVFYDDLVEKMEHAVKDPAFTREIRGQYKAFFIDEFQDVDGALWKVFSTLFHGTAFFLIGDPKQSIYRFRRADLYTYLKAKEEVNNTLSLDVNYRSSPDLVAALNHLFAAVPTLFSLPNRDRQAIVFHPVQAGRQGACLVDDGKGVIHCMEVEKQPQLVSTVLDEVEELIQRKIPPSSIAILVRDRFSAHDVLTQASLRGIAMQSKQSCFLFDTLAYRWLSELMQTALYPGEMELNYILQGPLFLAYRKTDKKERFLQAADLLEKQGVLPFFQELKEKMALQESLLLQKNGSLIYIHLQQLMERMARECPSPYFAPLFLRKLKKESRQIEENRAHVPPQDAVQVLTIHASKGLEFDLVFALGLTAKPHREKTLLLDEERGCITYTLDLWQKHQSEEEAEEMRLLYVACTRARERLYLLSKKDDDESIMARFWQKRLENQTVESFAQAPGFSYQFLEKASQQFL